MRAGISPVIATVIIVAVAIAIAIAVAFWMTGIVGLFTGFEQVKVVSVYAEWDRDNKQWNVTVTLRNTGTADATIDEIFLNGKPFSYWEHQNKAAAVSITVKRGNETVASGSENDLASLGGKGVPLPAGTSAAIEIVLPGPGASPALFEHGQSLEIKIHTASGQEYPKLTTLP